MWIESESKLHYGKFKHNPHASQEGTDAAKRRIVEYWRKVQTEKCGFETGGPAGKITMRSKIGRTSKSTAPIPTLHNEFMRPATPEETLHQFLYRKQLCHIIEKEHHTSDERLLSSHVCSYPEFMQHKTCKHVLAHMVYKNFMVVPPEYDARRIGTKKRAGRPKNVGTGLQLLDEVLLELDEYDNDFTDNTVAT